MKFAESIKKEWNFYLAPLMIIVSVIQGILSDFNIEKLEIVEVNKRGIVFSMPFFHSSIATYS